MSIIYDALKKIETETKRTKDTKEYLRRPKRRNSKLFLIIYVICALIIIALIQFLRYKSYDVSPASRFLKRRSVSQVPTTPSIPKPSPVLKKGSPLPDRKLPPLSLTGIFFSEGEYIALINDQMIKTGESIEGVGIDKIDSKGVEIKFEGSFFRLELP